MNIIHPDTVPSKYDDEVFDIKSIRIFWNGYGHITYDETNTSEIIESSNYLTILSMDKQTIRSMKYDDIEGYEFELKQPIEL